MSHFLRQLHVMSSLKSGSEADKIKPFYKAIAPMLSAHPAVMKDLHTQVVNKNLILKCQDEPSQGNSANKKEKRPLAVILSWMLAKGSHLDKYCNIYLQKGFDVLTVHISPQQMLFPTSGSQIVASNILDYIANHKEYDRIMVHAFSVGAYLMGEVFVQLHENEAKYQDFTKRVVGMVLDSAVDFEGIPSGFPRAVAKNPLTVKVLEWYVSAHLAVMNNIATKHYLKASKFFHNTPLSCPALFIVSEADKVGTPAQNQSVADDWAAKGVEVQMKCFQKSSHVSHMHFYRDEYLAEIDNFISKLKLKGSL